MIVTTVRYQLLLVPPDTVHNLILLTEKYQPNSQRTSQLLISDGYSAAQLVRKDGEFEMINLI